MAMQLPAARSQLSKCPGSAAYGSIGAGSSCKCKAHTHRGRRTTVAVYASSHNEQDTICVQSWSSPRCVSTSLMYAFAQRPDCEVVDEPLYAHYLQLTGASRPYRDQVLAEQEHDGRKVIRDTIFGPQQKKVRYIKQMAKHRVGLGREILQQGRHMLLLRSPQGVIQSFAEVLEPTLHETCFPMLCEIYSELRAAGKPPPVVLSEDLVSQPEGTIRALCAALSIPWDPAMLSWPTGARPEDGCWAPWWYASTHNATGFGSRSKERPPRPLPDELKPLLEECRPLYELLRSRALRPLSALQLQEARDAEAGSLQRGTPQNASSQQAGLTAVSKHKEKRGTHVFEDDPRNLDIMIGLRDGVTGAFNLVWRPHAKVSVFDSGFMLGDGVWEGIRLHKGVLAFGQRHLKRLFEGAKAIDMDLGLTKSELQDLIYQTVDANGMQEASGIHIRLMVTRGLLMGVQFLDPLWYVSHILEKPTPYQNPNITVGLPTIVVIPEHKRAAATPKERGIRLFTVHVRRGAPDVQDPNLNSHSKLNCITACIQANRAGADEGLMLDPHGFVATCNSVNFFVVRDGEVWTATSKYQMPGITRAHCIELCRANGIPVRELDFSLTQVYGADEAFATGTFGGQTPVVEVDGRVIGDGRRGPITQRLQELYATLMDEEVALGRISIT